MDEKGISWGVLAEEINDIKVGEPRMVHPSVLGAAGKHFCDRLGRVQGI